MTIKDTDHLFLNFALSKTGDAIFLITYGTNFIYVNDAACRMTGYSRDELLSMRVSDVSPFFSLDRFRVIWGGIKKNKVVTFESIYRSKDRSEFPVEVTSNYFEYKGEEYNCAIVRDITSRKESEQKLRESEEKLRAIINNSNMAIYIKDLDSRYILANKWYKFHLGLDEKDILGRTSHDIFPQNIADAFRADDLEVIENKSHLEFENHLLIGNETRTYHSLKFPLLDNSGKPYAVCGMSADITERKKMEEAKDKLQAQLLHSQKMEAIGILAGGIAHDFNNILTAIRNFSYIGMKKYHDPGMPANELFDNIRKASHRASTLARQLLTFSHREPTNLKLLDMNMLIKDLLVMLTQIIGEDISIKTVLDTELWRVMGDSGKMEQLLMNLFVNSRDAMPKGGTITVMSENITIDNDSSCGQPPLCPGRFIRLTVNDTGTGIKKEHMQHIFEPFYTTKKNETSSGLGLSVVYGILEDHKGSVNVVSEEGKGASFMVYLPAVSTELHKKDDVTAFAENYMGRGERILLVEDDAQVRESTRMFLTDEGYVVLDVENAMEALNVFNKNKGGFSLVISDYILPGKNGLQLIEELRRLNPHLKTILISGYMNRQENLEEIEQSGIRFLRKPFDVEEILCVIREVLRDV